MKSIIELDHLTDQQAWLAQQLWLCESLDEVRELREEVDPSMYHDLSLMMEMIVLADLDNLVQTEDDHPEATDIMRKVEHDTNGYE